MNWIQRKIYLYNVTFGLFMLDPWERYLFNTLVFVLMWFVFYNGSHYATESAPGTFAGSQRRIASKLSRLTTSPMLCQLLLHLIPESESNLQKSKCSIESTLANPLAVDDFLLLPKAQSPKSLTQFHLARCALVPSNRAESELVSVFRPVTMAGRSSMRGGGQTSLRTRIMGAVAVGVLLGCVFAWLYPHGLFKSDPDVERRSVSKSGVQVGSSACESSERVKMLKADFGALSEKNSELKKQVRELTEKLRLAEQGKDSTQKQVLELGEQKKAGPFGTVKSSRINPTVLPDESVNPRLAELLVSVAVNKEIIVALANSNVKQMLEIWFTNIKRVGIQNYLVVALDDEIKNFCQSNNVPVYQRDPDETIDSVAKTGGNHAVSGLKFRILREFLQLGYSVLLSDVDIVYLQNPFDHLYRDSDVESMSDGHNNMTAYGYNDVFDEPGMGWARYAHTMRIWVYNSGFFYIRPTIPSIELLDRVADKLAHEDAWDQAVFNEELFYPSRPGYTGLHASRRTMDIYMFMNSKVLFKTVRKDAVLIKLKPVIVHLNYHPDKLPRMLAVVEFYVNGKQDALNPFPDGSQ